MSDPARKEGNLEELAERAVATAVKKGAGEASASARKGRSVSVQYRNGELEVLREAQSASLSVSLFVDGRYSGHSTNDLREESLDGFVDRAIALTRLLAEDPHRALPDPKLYEGRATADLEIWDSSYEAVPPEKRKELAARVGDAAGSVDGPIISVTGSYTDQRSESARVHSNGFSGSHRGTQFWIGAEVSVRDEGDRKPEDYHFVGSRLLSALPDPVEIGREAARRALSRLGQKKLASAKTKVLVDGRVAGRLLGPVLGAMSGASIQQQRSFLIDRLGTKIGSPLLTVVDDPLLPGGFGSRLYDGDGIAAKRRTLIGEGVLDEYLLDVYYARKLGVEPTGGGTGNILVPPGHLGPSELAREAVSGVYVTGLLGGNSDGTTGDFSLGITGFEISGGEILGPIGEMNLTGSHADLWERLVAVGNDPYQYSSYRLPSFLFDGVAVSGS